MSNPPLKKFRKNVSNGEVRLYHLRYINYYMENGLLVRPFIEKDIQNENIIEIDIEKLEKASIEDDKKENGGVICYKEYDFDASGNMPDINEDLLNNFECSENVYAEGNKRYYKKKKEKKNKKKNKKKNNYCKSYNYPPGVIPL